MGQLLQRIRGLVSGRRLDRDLDEDVRAHLELLAADYERQGLTPEQARQAARRAFGGVEQMKEIYRDRAGVSALRACVRDLRFAARLLVKERGFTAAAVVALALGIACNNTVFVIVNGLLVRDLPFADPDRFVTVGARMGGASRATLSFLDLQDWAAANRTFAGLGAASEATMNVADDGGVPERFIGAYISANVFTLTGHAPLIGRGFDARDDRAGAPPVVILGHTIWRNRYGADPGVVGRVIRVNGVPSTVVGVMAEGFGFPTRSRLWQPLAHMSPELLQRRDARLLEGLGLLAPGTTRAQAVDDLRRIAGALAVTNPETDRNVQAVVAPFRSGIGGRVRETFPILMALVGFVLLIACANVANLMLARGAHRAHEIAVRLAIGAGRAQIVRQLLVESLLLAGIAGLLGLALSAAGVRAFWNALSQNDIGLPYWIDLSMDWRVFTFLASVCLGTGLVFGMLPAIHASRTRLAGVLVATGGGAAGTAPRQKWTRRLVIAQLAFTPMLLVAAGLMTRSVVAQQQSDAGVDTAGLVRMRLDLSGVSYQAPDARARFYRQLEDAFADAPELRATLASHGPFEGGPGRQISIDGRPASDEQGRSMVRVVTVGRSYFEVLAESRVRGSGFTRATDAQTPAAAIVNERFAATFFAGREPMGHRLGLTSPNPGAGGPVDVEIIGVARDIRQSGTESQGSFEPIVYLPYAANPIALSSVLVRSDDPAAAVAARVREYVRAIDRDLPLYDVRTLDESLAQSDERTGLLVFGSLVAGVGAIALLLATVGVYAVTAYTTAQRTREFGIRVALGSRPAQIVSLVTRQAARQLVMGLAIGAAGALGIAQLMRGILVGVGPWDPVTLLGVIALLILVTLGAAMLPARRAMRLNPVAALRSE